MKMSRFALSVCAVAMIGSAATVSAQQLTEGFNTPGTLPAGWITRNQSTSPVAGGNCWGSIAAVTDAGGNPVFTPFEGAGMGAAFFNCISAGTGTLNVFLLTPSLTQLQNGNTITFQTQSAGGFADRLQVRLCLGTTCGDAGSTGTSTTDVGQYTTLLLDINPTLTATGYPGAWALQTITLAGLPPGVNTGRIAFRYFVTNGGPTGANSNVVMIDQVGVSTTVPVTLQQFSID